MFQTCKRRFKYKYIDKIRGVEVAPSKYLSFGNSMHTTLAKYNTFTLSEHRTLENLHKLLRANWVRDGYKTLDEERTYGQRALEMLTRYHLEPLDQGKQGLGIEEMVHMDINENFSLCGKVDRIIRNENDEIETLDYKTSATIKTINNPLDDLQLPIYTLLTEHLLGSYPKYVSYYYLVPNKKIIQPIDSNTIQQSIAKLLLVFEEVKNEEDYDYSPTPYCMKNCEYSKICEGPNDLDALVANELRTMSLTNRIDTVF